MSLQRDIVCCHDSYHFKVETDGIVLLYPVSISCFKHYSKFINILSSFSVFR